MAWSKYMADIRGLIGTRLLLTPAAGICLFDDHGRMLLARHRHDGSWGAPSGGAEPGETPEETARREYQEETGLRLGSLTLIGAYGGPQFLVRYPDGTETAYVIVLYGAAQYMGSIVLQDDELTEWRWVAHESLETLQLMPHMRLMLPDAFDWHRRQALR
jgi:8-oxo-dGTP pyrophosphatase MutT (NUDIX family)